MRTSKSSDETHCYYGCTCMLYGCATDARACSTDVLRTRLTTDAHACSTDALLSTATLWRQNTYAILYMYIYIYLYNIIYNIRALLVIVFLFFSILRFLTRSTALSSYQNL